MNNYFRLTVYHPEKDICAILDSNGLYEKVWQFSSFLISKNFKILEVSNKDNMIDVNIGFADEDSNKILLRAVAHGKPKYFDHVIDGQKYKAVQVKDKIYIPEK